MVAKSWSTMATVRLQSARAARAARIASSATETRRLNANRPAATDDAADQARRAAAEVNKRARAMEL
jgi:hypothetical protein